MPRTTPSSRCRSRNDRRRSTGCQGYLHGVRGASRQGRGSRPVGRRGLFRGLRGGALGLRSVVGSVPVRAGRAERLARLPGPALEPAPGCPGQRQALDVGLEMTDAGPPAARGTFTAFGARHVKGVAAARWVAAACFVVCGAVLLAFGQWWGAFLFAPAGLNGSLAYLVPRWNLLRDAPDNAKLST